MSQTFLSVERFEIYTFVAGINFAMIIILIIALLYVQCEKDREHKQEHMELIDEIRRLKKMNDSLHNKLK
jgi:preprotein translocase subunit YajC